MARNRYSPQKKQEQVSRTQFKSFLEQHEWITGDIEPDLGEDILVRIYRNGVSTGLSMYVQIKSVKAIVEHQLSTGEISYDFDTDDLGHWEVQTPMVFLLIWDVSQIAGWWLSVKDAIKYLERHSPSWRSNKTVAVRIPFENRIDEYGLEKIQGILIQLYGPVIGRDKEIEINAKFLFPLTPEGQVKYEALQRAITAGDEIKLEGQYIQEFSLPEWWTRIYGTPDPKEMVVWMKSIPSEETLPTHIEFHSERVDPVQFPYIEFKRVKQGSEEITLTNEHQNTPIKFTLVLSKFTNTHTLTVNSNLVGLDSETALNLINIEKMYAVGGIVTIIFLKTSERHQISIPPESHSPPHPRVAQFIEDLAIIQKKTGKSLKIPDPHILTFGQMNEAHELAIILTTGQQARTVGHIDIDLQKPSLAVFKDSLHQESKLFFRFRYEEIIYDLLSEHFSLGPCITTVRGKLSNSPEELLSWYKKANDDDYYKIELIDPEIIDEYQKWQPIDNH